MAETNEAEEPQIAAASAKAVHRRRRLSGLRRIAALSGFTGGSASEPSQLGSRL
jgi:hypothetical protein